MSTDGSLPDSTPGLSRRAALGLHAATLITFLASSAAPTPLYRVYQENWGFSPILLTLIFSVYAFSLLAALLVVGSLSDHVGRRPVIFAAILLQALAMVLFIIATSVPWLIAARVVQGLAVGAASGAVGAALVDLNLKQGPVINSISPLAGMAVGALGSSVLVEFAPEPMRLVYVVLLVALLLQAAFVWFAPETVKRQAGALASLRPQINVPERIRRPLLMITPINIAGWALAGFYLSLMPSLVSAAIGIRSPLISGIVVAILTTSGAITIFLRRRQTPLHNLTIGPIAMTLGVATVLVGANTGLVPLLFLGTLLAGTGLGAGFLGSVTTIMPQAAADERAGLLSAFYVQSYLAFSLPAIAAGFAAHSIGLQTTADIYGLAVIILTAGGAVALRTSARRASIKT